MNINKATLPKIDYKKAREVPGFIGFA